MRIIKKQRRQILIACFVLVLTLPWIVGGVVRICMPKTYEYLTVSTREKRDMTSGWYQPRHCMLDTWQRLEV